MRVVDLAFNDRGSSHHSNVVAPRDPVNGGDRDRKMERGESIDHID